MIVFLNTPSEKTNRVREISQKARQALIQAISRPINIFAGSGTSMSRRGVQGATLSPAKRTARIRSSWKSSFDIRIGLLLIPSNEGDSFSKSFDTLENTPKTNFGVFHGLSIWFQLLEHSKIIHRGIRAASFG